MSGDNGATRVTSDQVDRKTPQACMCVVLASGNPHKLAEFRRIFAGSRVRLLSPTDVGCELDVDETGTSFAENARLKAIAYARLCRQWTLADDSGLEIDALGGAPGVRSSRFAGPNATDADRNRRVIELVRGFPDSDRSARYRCAIAVANPKGAIACETEATVEGSIGHLLRGECGFGFDPLFVVGPGETTLAELPGVAKDVISDRGQGGRAARAFLERVLPGGDS